MQPGEDVAFRFTVRNVGDMGNDTFNFWPYVGISYFEEDGTTPLSDTDLSPNPDTGPLPEGASKTIVARVHVPDATALGERYAVSIQVYSSLGYHGDGKMDYAMTVAPDLAQAFRSEDDGAMTLALVRSSLETDIKVTADNYGGTYPGLIRQANGNYVYAWQKLRCVGGGCKTEAEELQFTIRDATGALVKSVSRGLKNKTRRARRGGKMFGLPCATQMGISSARRKT